MSKIRFLSYATLLVIALLCSLSCKDSSKDSIVQDTESRDIQVVSQKAVDTLLPSSERLDKPQIDVEDTVTVMVVQCSNGYEYAQAGYDLEPILEKELSQLNGIIVKPFPLKTLMNVVYQGVYDKKYCMPIIEKVNVDYLILNKFEGSIYERIGKKLPWGYETKIVNTKTLDQTISIGASNLSSFAQIEEHIKNNVEQLKEDIRAFR